jgi:hypothetical protein
VVLGTAVKAVCGLVVKGWYWGRGRDLVACGAGCGGVCGYVMCSVATTHLVSRGFRGGSFDFHIFFVEMGEGVRGYRRFGGTFLLLLIF